MIAVMRKEYASLRRRPFLTPVWLGVLASVVVLALAAWVLSSASTTLVYVMPAAEALADGSADPGLSPGGQSQAGRLAALLGAKDGEAGINAIFVDETRRTQQMARPLATALSVPVIVVSWTGESSLAKRLLADYRGQRVLVIGRPEHVAGIVKALSGRSIGDVGPSGGYVVAVPRLSRSIVSRLYQY